MVNNPLEYLGNAGYSPSGFQTIWFEATKLSLPSETLQVKILPPRIILTSTRTYRGIVVRLTRYLLLLIVGSIARADVTPSIHLYDSSSGQEREVTTRYLGDVNFVRVTGLKPNSNYVVSNQLGNPAGTYESSLITQSDSSGTIDSRNAIPTQGSSYDHAESDGLFWSMKLNPANPSVPLYVYQITVKESDAIVQHSTFPISYLKPGVKTVDLPEGLVGKLYLPAGTGAHPAIITYSGSEGGALTGEMNAMALANQGYVALGIGYFNAPGLPDVLANIPLEYFKSAIEFLRGRSEVKNGEIIAMGPSRGGELTLLLGSTFPELKGVIALVPSPYRWNGFDANGDVQPSWTLGGQGLPFLSIIGDFVPVTLLDGTLAKVNRPAFEKGLNAASPAQLEAATSKIEQTNGPILMIGAADDQVWPSCDLAKMAMQRLRDKNHPFSDEVYCLPDAGHAAVGIPFAPSTSLSMYDPPIKSVLFLGGTLEGNAAAQRFTWSKILSYLKKYF